MLAGQPCSIPLQPASPPLLCVQSLLPPAGASCAAAFAERWQTSTQRRPGTMSRTPPPQPQQSMAPSSVVDAACSERVCNCSALAYTIVDGLPPAFNELGAGEALKCIVPKYRVGSRPPGACVSLLGPNNGLGLCTPGHTLQY